jgi:hypothetical protein
MTANKQTQSFEFIPPTDVEGLRDFYHPWTNFILQLVETKFWKNVDVLFRISSKIYIIHWYDNLMMFLMTFLSTTLSVGEVDTQNITQQFGQNSILYCSHFELLQTC